MPTQSGSDKDVAFKYFVKWFAEWARFAILAAKNRAIPGKQDKGCKPGRVLVTAYFSCRLGLCNALDEHITIAELDELTELYTASLLSLTGG